MNLTILIQILSILGPAIMEIIKMIAEWIGSNQTQIDAGTLTKAEALSRDITAAKNVWPGTDESDLRIYHEIALKVFRSGKTTDQLIHWFKEWVKNSHPQLDLDSDYMKQWFELGKKTMG